MDGSTKNNGCSCCSIRIHQSYQTSPQKLKKFLSKPHKSIELLPTNIVLLQHILWKETRPKDRSRKTKTHSGCPFRHQLSEKGIVNARLKGMTILAWFWFIRNGLCHSINSSNDIRPRIRDPELSLVQYKKTLQSFGSKTR